jgi:hypothetical protein
VVLNTTAGPVEVAPHGPGAGHAITIREDWAELYSELIEIEKDQGLELDPGDRFEMLASPAPTKEDLRILGAPLDNRNIYGMMR